MRTWTKRDPVKNYFPLPNEIYQLGLSHGAIAVYGYLLRIEDRRTYQCHPSYATIGKAVGMSRNTVCKYVRSLEEKGLIHTEPSTIITKDGRIFMVPTPGHSEGHMSVVVRAEEDATALPHDPHRAP